MNIAYMGGRQAGIIGLLTIQALGHDLAHVVAYDANMAKIARSFTWEDVYRSLSEVNNDWEGVDLLLSVHGREIVSQSLLDRLPLGGINVHPCLYGFKGKNPVERFLKSNCKQASVGAHCMTSHIDEGEVLCEEYLQRNGSWTTVEEVYNHLYPLYPLVIHSALNNLENP